MKKTIGLLLAVGVTVSAAACSPGRQAYTTTQEVGNVTSDLSVFDRLPGNVTITFSLAE